MSASSPFTIMETATGTGSASAITFSSIPQTFKSLMIVGQVKSDIATGNDGFYLTVNGDATVSHYSGKSTFNYNGTMYYQDYYSSYAGWYVTAIPSDGWYADKLGWMDVLIPNYTQSSNWQTMQVETGIQNTNTTESMFAQANGAWTNSTTAAVTSLTFTLMSGNWTTDSKITMYGLG
tara:strand:+ start:3149 stop:3682 length:534 start_codon:yes stop_codon:yes gene_type:complete